MCNDSIGLEILRSATQGDSFAWERIVHSYTHRVYSLLLQQCRDTDLAEEITQETFVKVYQALRQGSYDEQGRFEPWLFRIATNALRSEKRRAKRHAKPMDMSPAATSENDQSSAFAIVNAQMANTPDTNPAHIATKREEITLIHEVISQMDPYDRDILHLRHSAGLSFSEIAETLDEPLGTVLSRAHRAMQKLRKKLNFLEASPD